MVAYDSLEEREAYVVLNGSLLLFFFFTMNGSFLLKSPLIPHYKELDKWTRTKT